MTSLNIRYIDSISLEKFILENQIIKYENILLQIFTGVIDYEFIQNLISKIKALVPHIKIIGATTSGEILEANDFVESTVLSFSLFENTKIETYSTEFYKTSSDTATHIISKFPKNRTPKVVISFIDSLNMNGEEYINEFYKYDKNLTISGGLAGDNGEFKNTIVFTQDGVIKSGAVAVLLFNECLEVVTQASFGWESIGKTMTITKSDKNIVYEIDGIKTFDIYAKYLGIDIAKELPKVGVEFPLIIKRGKLSIPRAVLKIGENGSLIFAGNLHIGDKVKFGYGDIYSIINYSNKMKVKQSESIFIYSCMARKSLMKDNIRLELIPLSAITNVSGFFTYGEFYSSRGNMSHELLNETMTILSLKENGSANCKHNSCKSDIKELNKVDVSNSSTLKALSHLISQTSLELEEINSSLEKRVKEEVGKNIKKEKLLQRQSRLAQMGEMINMIAHQWRQPLSAISSSIIGIESKISIGKFDFSQESDREIFLKFLNRKLSGISDYVNTLSETIDDFRNFFKPDKKKELVSFSEPVKKALKIVESSMKTKGIKILTLFKNDDNILFYKNEMMQVILNILKNSEDNFIEKNIKNPKIKITTYFKDKNYTIRIEDNGGGIPNKILPKIFDPYFSTKNEKNGTGIGLYMSKIMVEEHHNGKLSAKNIEDGISFKIEIIC